MSFKSNLSITGPTSDSQNNLPQVTSISSVAINPNQILKTRVGIKTQVEQYNKMRNTANCFGGKPDDEVSREGMSIAENDMIFTSRDPETINVLFPSYKDHATSRQLVVPNGKSPFASFAGRSHYGNKMIEYLINYKFLGVAMRPLNMDVDSEIELLAIGCSGVVPWTNYTDVTVETGAPMSWTVHHPDVYNGTMPVGSKKAKVTQSARLRGVFVPWSMIAKNTEKETTQGMCGDFMDIGCNTFIIGHNAGRPVAPGAKGDLCLNF
jgi:hypothetical protein